MLYEWNLDKPLSCGMFGRMMQNHGWQRKNLRKNTDHLLVFAISGTADFVVDGVKIQINAGEVLLVPAGALYIANTDGQCEYYFFRFSASVVPLSSPPVYPAFDRSASFTLPKVPHKCVSLAGLTPLQEHYQKFYQCIISCVEHADSMTLAGRLAMDVELQKILLILAQIQEQKTGGGAYPLALTKMLDYVRKNITKPMTPSELCAYCGISSSYGARLFKKHLNTGMAKYIMAEKLHYACELMRNTGMNISQIAAYLGFCDVYYFSKCFKEKYGKSPTQMFPRT